MDTNHVTSIRVEGLVLLKIIKHCQEETLLPNDYVNGVLLGLSMNDTLEVTNCFPTSKIVDDDQNNFDVNSYDGDMIRNLRQLNSDYLAVGYYIGGYGSSFLNRSGLETLFQYKMQVSEAILLTYDPACATRGQLGMKAYRLSESIVGAMLETEKRLRLTSNLKSSEIPWECDPSLHMGKLTFTRLLEELPITMRNSKLATILLKDMVDKSDELAPASMSDNLLNVKALNSFSGLHLSMGSNLEQQLRYLLLRLDAIQDLQFNYQRTLGKLATTLPTKEQKIKELAPIRLETAFLSAQVDQSASSIAQLAGQTVGKLMMAKAIHQYRDSAQNDSIDSLA